MMAMADLGLRVAVTGASGYIGGRLIERLHGDSAGYVLATDVRPPEAGQPVGASLVGAQSPPEAGQPAGASLAGAQSPHEARICVEFVRHDIAEPLGDMFRRRRIDAVVHLAYVLNPGRRVGLARRVNVGGTANVIRACEDAGVSRVVYLSSASVYGARADNPDWLTEDDPPRPLRRFAYSEQKLEAERLLTEFAARTGTKVSIIRACPVMGPNADNFIANAFRKPVLPVLGDADPPMQFIHEDDLVETLIRCLRSKPSGIYNAAGDGAIRWGEMAALAGRRTLRLPASAWRALAAAGWALGIQNDSPAVGLDFIRYRWMVSADKLKRELGVEMRYTSREAWEARNAADSRCAR